jgi:hypothetical protein
VLTEEIIAFQKMEIRNREEEIVELGRGERKEDREDSTNRIARRELTRRETSGVREEQ